MWALCETDEKRGPQCPSDDRQGSQHSDLTRPLGGGCSVGASSGGLSGAVGLLPPQVGTPSTSDCDQQKADSSLRVCRCLHCETLVLYRDSIPQPHTQTTLLPLYTTTLYRDSRPRLCTTTLLCARICRAPPCSAPEGARGATEWVVGNVSVSGDERGNDTSKSTGRSGRQKVATRRNMRREERVTVQGPVKEQQPDGMSHRGWHLHSAAHLFPDRKAPLVPLMRILFC